MRDSFILLGNQMLLTTAHRRVYWDLKLKGSFCQAWPTPRQVSKIVFAYIASMDTDLRSLLMYHYMYNTITPLSSESFWTAGR